MYRMIILVADASYIQNCYENIDGTEFRDKIYAFKLSRRGGVDMKLELVTIAVNNLEESVVFYTEVLGLIETRRINPFEGVDIVFMRDEEGSIVELIKRSMRKETENKAEATRVSMTFGIEDIESVKLMLTGRNIEIVDGPMENYIFIQDPNGIRIGIKQLV